MTQPLEFYYVNRTLSQQTIERYLISYAPSCSIQKAMKRNEPRRAAEGKSSSPFRPFIMQEVLQGHCHAACTENTAEAGVVQEKAGWIRHLEAFFPYSPQLSWSMCYITIICILVYFPRKPLWNTVKLMQITMVALTDNLTITLLCTHEFLRIILWGSTVPSTKLKLRTLRLLVYNHTVSC